MTTVSAAIYNHHIGHDYSTQLHYCATAKCLHNSTRSPPRHLLISPINNVMLQLSFITLKFHETASRRLRWRTALARLPASPGQCHQSWSEGPVINDQFVCLLHRQYCDILIDSGSSDSWLLGYRVGPMLYRRDERWPTMVLLHYSLLQPQTHQSWPF